MKVTDYLGNVLTKDGLLPTLDSDGVALIYDAGCSNLTDHLASVVRVYPHPHAVGGEWTLIRPSDVAQAMPGMTGFTANALLPHTDRSFLPRPPSLLCFILLERPVSGGEALIVDTAALYRQFSLRELADMQRELWLSDSHGKDRQQIFSLEGNLCVNRYRSDQVAFPRATSKRSRNFLTELEKIIASPMRLHLRPGEGYLIHNHRILHGRTEFVGPRLAARLLGFAARHSSHQFLNEGFRINSEGEQR